MASRRRTLLGHDGGRIGYVQAYIGAIILFLLLVCQSAPAAAQVAACTLTASSGNAIPSLQVTAGSSDNIIVDTNTPSTLSVILGSCGGQYSYLFEVYDGVSYPQISYNTDVTLMSGSIIKLTRTGSGSSTRFQIHYTPAPGFTGTETIGQPVAQNIAANPAAARGQPVDIFQELTPYSYLNMEVTVVSPSAPTAALTSLAPSTIYASGTSTVTVTLSNPNGSAALSGVADTVTLPSGVTVASSPGASTSCGGTLTATAGASSVSLSGGALSGGGTCTMVFDVTSATVGTHVIPSGTPSATGAAAGSAGSTANLTVQTAPSAPTISASWDQVTVAAGGSRTLTLTLTNPNGSTQLTGVAVAAAALNASLTGASPSTNCTGGTASYVGGSRQLSLSGATLNGGASCTVTLSVSSSTAGTYSYTSGTVSASGPVSLTGSTATTGNLTVIVPPTAAVGVSSPVSIGASSTLTLTLANPNSGAGLSGLSDSITLPSNVAVAASPNLSNNGCGGTATATAGSGSIALSGGSLAASASCTITVSIVASAAGSYSIPTGTPGSSEGGSGVTGTSTTLTVNAVPPVLSAFTATAVGYGSSGNSINVATGTAATNSPTGWLVSKDGVSFAAAAESVNHSGSNNVSINSSGVASYAAPAGRRGSDSFYVRASNGGGDSNVVLVTVPINNPTLSISLSGSGTRGSALSGVQIGASGGQSPYSCSSTLVSGALPAGVTLNSDCTLSGTPTEAGTFSFVASVTDSSTGTGAFTQSSGTLSLTIVPQAPTISGLSPTSGSTAGGTSVVISGTNFTQVSGISFGGTVVTGVVSSESSITVSAPAHAAGTVDVSVTTSGGTSANTAADDYSYIAPPGAPVVVSPANASRISTTLPTYSGTAGNSLSITVYVDSSSIGTTTSSAGGAWSLAQPTGLAEGAHSIYATATNAGVVSANSTANSFTVDTTAPPAPVVVAPANGARTNDTTPTVTGTAEAGASVVVTIGSTVLPGVNADGSGNFSATPGSPLADATYNVSAVASDAAGNASPSSNVNSVTIDSAAPAVPVITSPTAGSVTGLAPVLTGTAEANATVQLFIDSSLQGSTTANGSGNWSYTSSTLSAGAHTAYAVAQDAAGNASTASTSINFTAAGAPVASAPATVSVAFDVATAIDLTSAISGNVTSIAVASAPGHGSTSVTGLVVTYTPTTGYYGADSFTYTATGPGGVSAAATVSLTVATPPAPSVQQGSETVPGVGSTSAGTPTQLDLTGLVSGIFTTVQISRQASHGVVSLGGVGTTGVTTASVAHTASASSPVLATYSPNPGFVGVDSFDFVAVGPGGTSVPATFTVNVVGMVPTVQAKSVNAGDGATVSVELTLGASEGPFTDARVIGISPASAATATIVASGSGAGRSYRLDVTTTARFAGQVVIGYSLSNQYGESAPANVTVTVSARPNPANDPNVRGLSDAQAESTRRFASVQISHFMQRNEQLHGGGGSAAPQMGWRINWRDVVAGRAPSPGESDAGFAHRLIAPRMSAAGEGGGTMAALAGRDSATSTSGPGSGPGSDSPSGPVQAAAAHPDGDGQRRIGQLAVWTAGAIELGTIDRRTDRAKISATTSGLSAGMDIKLADRLVTGIGVGYGNEVSWIGGSAVRLHGESSMIAGYASYAPADTAFIDGMVGWGQLDYRSLRKVSDVDAVASGYREGDMLFGALSTGIDRGRDGLRWSAYGRFEWMRASLGAYAETGAGRYNLRWDRHALTSLGGVLGGRAEWMRKTGFGSVTPRLRGEWRHEFARSDPQWLDYADIPGSAFYRIDGQGWRSNQFDLSMGTRFDLSSWVLDVEYAMMVSAGQRSGRLKLGISKAF